MKFECVNRDGRTMSSTTYMSCLPTERQIESMSNVGYKFKLDGKIISKKKVKEIIRGSKNEKNTNKIS